MISFVEIITFVLKDGSKLNVRNALNVLNGTFEFDKDSFEKAKKAIKLYIDSHNVSFKLEPGKFFPDAGTLIVEGKSITFIQVPSVGAVLDAFGIDKNELAAYITKAEADAAVKAQAAADAEALEEEKILAKLDAALANAKIDLDLAKVDPSHQTFINDLIIKLDAAIVTLKDKTQGDITARARVFGTTLNPVFEEVRNQVDISWGDYLVNILKELANAFIYAFTFGQVNGFFQPVVSVDLEKVKKCAFQLEEAVAADKTPAPAI